MSGIVLAAVALVAIVGWRWFHKRRLLLQYGKGLEAYNNGAFVTLVVPTSDGRFEMVDRLTNEIQSRSGQRALLVQTYPSRAIQLLNKDGNLSTRSAYFISRYSRNWLLTSRVHLVRFRRGRGGWGFKSGHPAQHRNLSEQVIGVIEFDTSRYARVDVWAFAEMQKQEADKWKLRDP